MNRFHEPTAHAGDAPAPIRVVAADDHPLVRDGLASVIGAEPDLCMVAQAADGQEAVERFREHRPDVMLMDLRMPVLDGVGAITAIRREFPEARVLALTSYEGDEDIFRALQAGARGYLFKDMLSTDVLSAVRAVHGGQRFLPAAVAARLAEHVPRSDLTPQEREVLRLVARGMSNKEIGRTLFCTENTVKVHVKHLLAKLGVQDRTAAVVVALQRGILHLS